MLKKTYLFYSCVLEKGLNGQPLFLQRVQRIALNGGAHLPHQHIDGGHIMLRQELHPQYLPALIK